MDRKLADRRLKELKGQIGCLTLTDDAKLGFEAVANRWLESIKHTLAPSTIVQREIRIKNLALFFKGVPLRNITPFQCEQWAVKRGAKLATQTFVAARAVESIRATADAVTLASRAGRVWVKLLTEGSELYVLVESQDRVNKERAMRRRQLKAL